MDGIALLPAGDRNDLFEETARKYNWDLEEWDLRDTDWRSLMLSGNWMFSNYFSLRLTSQISRFSTDWQSGENSCSHRHWTGPAT